MNEEILQLIRTWQAEVETEIDKLNTRAEHLDGMSKKREVMKVSELQLINLKLQQLLNLFPPEEDKDTLFAYIDRLNTDEAFRLSESRRMQLLRHATEKARERMYQDFCFMNGEWSKLILNSESVFYE